LWRVFECDSAPGVTDILTDDRPLDSVIKPSGIPNLDLLTSGPIPPNPAELFESAQMDALIDQLRKHPRYDMIVFDSAPTLLTTDTPVLAAKMDGVLVVLEAGRTTEEQALMTKEMLTNSGARVLGAVLNKARSSGAGYYYYGESQNGSGGAGSRNEGGIMGSLKKVGEKIGI
jgi:capsular exopolysaccharide synthesis family protein